MTIVNSRGRIEMLNGVPSYFGGNGSGGGEEKSLRG
jgi:hypothetical protein